MGRCDEVEDTIAVMRLTRFSPKEKDASSEWA